MSNVTSYVVKVCASEPGSGIRIFFPPFLPKRFSGITAFLSSTVPSSGAVIGRRAASFCVQTFLLLSAAFLAFYVKVFQQDSYPNLCMNSVSPNFNTIRTHTIMTKRGRRISKTFILHKI
jgi:hypothetical protein